MEKSKKIVLFDIDHTLFDTHTYLDLCFKELFHRAKASDLDRFLLVCHEIYRDIRKSSPFLVSKFVDTLIRDLKLSGDIKEFEDIFSDPKIIKASLYHDVLDELQALSSVPQTMIGIFSTGVHPMQQAKIASFREVLSSDHIYINETDKVTDIPKIVEKHQNEQIFVVDDLEKVLYSFKSKEKSVVTILIQRGERFSQQEQENYRPDYIITSLSELKNIIR